MSKLIQRFGLNTKGKDYAIGDLHGAKHRLMRALPAIGFNPDVDRLFSVGDLTDRGKDSEGTLLLTEEPWFFAVMGNHDYFLVQYHEKHGALKDKHYIQHGGIWAMYLPRDQRQRYVDIVNCLPIAIEVETLRGKVGVIHADVFDNNWDMTTYFLDKEPVIARQHWPLFWDRDRITNEKIKPVKGVVNLVVGHTPDYKPVRLANVVAIDTYGWASYDRVATPTLTFYDLADDEFTCVTFTQDETDPD